METSWESSSSWYDKSVGEEGLYYHTHVILPGVLKLLQLKEGDRLLDLGCGQGVLARHLPKKVDYLGLDLAPSLIREAKKRSNHSFRVGDITKPLDLKEPFSHAAIILALQNTDDPKAVLQGTAQALAPGGKCVIVINHPCFRIPRQSSWGVEEAKKLQYRRIDRYMSELKIPIQTHPGKKESSTTWSFHAPLSAYSKSLFESGFSIEKIEEWCSDKKSSGAAARMENRAREEFPLFVAILANKNF